MPVTAVTPLRPRPALPYNDTAALNDIHAILSLRPVQAERDLLGDLAEVLARAGRPMCPVIDIEISATETAWGWPVASTQAGGTAVYVRQHPAGSGLLVEITTKTETEYQQLAVTLDGCRLHPHRRPGDAA